jgi:hypothetical protein
MSRGNKRFSSIRTEGGLLPQELLSRIQTGDSQLRGLEPESYHLLPSERIGEAVNRSWNRMLVLWHAFQESLEKEPDTSFATGLTRERWLLPLFQELGFGRLLKGKAIELDGKTFAVSHTWAHSPIHLMGFRIDLDRRQAGVAGASQSSPHGLVQELLNRSDDYLWGFVSNGYRLRILRDHHSLTRQAYVEFDLQSIMDGEQYSEFFLLWMICHQSRVDAEKPEECWLETWFKTSRNEGIRALDKLRDGAEKAIESLGTGFLKHKANSVLRGALASGELDKQDYYREVLRLVYRIIFLFAAEDREMLLDPGADDTARDRYTRFYSMRRIRELADKRRGGPHGDLWQRVRLVMGKLDNGCPELALPALGSLLWSQDACPWLVLAECGNEFLLDAIRFLSHIQEGSTRYSVNWRNVGAEELGSIYESLLELHPRLNKEAGSFELDTAAGHERKTTGSYYTPSSLVDCLLDSALEPVIDARLGEAREIGRKERWRKERGSEGGRNEGVSREIGNREIGSRGRENEGAFVSGSDGMAEGDGSGGKVLLSDTGISQGRDLRNIIADKTGSGVHPGEHRRRMGQGYDERVSPISENRPGQREGTGNASSDLFKSEVGVQRKYSTGSGSADGSFPDDRFPDWFFEAQKQIGPHSLVPYSLLAENALLSLKICDPACGSGHFLMAAARRLAKRLAAVRSGEVEPGPAEVQKALRDVVGRCIYGVDINPMAVELCKVSLWMEALEPGKPLSFLDHRIKCGNSLLGATPELMEKGIPDGAFEPVVGDDRAACSYWKRENKRRFLAGRELFDIDETPKINLVKISSEMRQINSIPDDTIEGLRAKQKQYEAFSRSDEYAYGRFAADTWCAAFAVKKVMPEDGPEPILQDLFKRILRKSGDIPTAVIQQVKSLTEQYRWMHWHLEFPDVFRHTTPDSLTPSLPHSLPSGFDCVLGNPPWERVKLQEKEFFAERSPDIAAAPNAATRKRMIEALAVNDPSLYSAFMDARRQQENVSNMLRDSGRYPLCGRGDVNTYTVFAELNRQLINNKGRVGCIVQSGIATDDTTKFFFQDVMDTRSLVSLFDFENRKKIFPAVDSRIKFCLLTIGGPGSMPDQGASFLFFALDPVEVREGERVFTLTAEDIALINPNTRTCPIFRTKRDADITRDVYRRVPVLIDENREDGNPWGIKFMTMFHMSNDSHLFRTREEMEREGFVLRGNVFEKEADGKKIRYLPLYEAKMFHHYNHRFGDYSELPADSSSTQLPDVPVSNLVNSEFTVKPRYWVDELEVIEKTDPMGNPDYFIAFRDITNSTNERTVILSILPLVGVSNKAPILLSTNDVFPVCLAILSSFVFDFCTRQKISSTSLNYFIFKQLPLVTISVINDTLVSLNIGIHWLIQRIVELTYTSYEVNSLSEVFDYDSSPFMWNHDRRMLIRNELDAFCFLLYRISRDDVGYIMETFPIVKRKDIAQYGTYRTKDTILEIYDAMQKAIDTGEPYQTPLDPPPGPPTDADGNFIPMEEWDPDNWPVHIHRLEKGGRE